MRRSGMKVLGLKRKKKQSKKKIHKKGSRYFENHSCRKDFSFLVLFLFVLTPMLWGCSEDKNVAFLPDFVIYPLKNAGFDKSVDQTSSKLSSFFKGGGGIDLLAKPTDHVALEPKAYPGREVKEDCSKEEGAWKKASAVYIGSNEVPSDSYRGLKLGKLVYAITEFYACNAVKQAASDNKTITENPDGTVDNKSEVLFEEDEERIRTVRWKHYKDPDTTSHEMHALLVNKRLQEYKDATRVKVIENRLPSDSTKKAFLKAVESTFTFFPESPNSIDFTQPKKVERSISVESKNAEDNLYHYVVGARYDKDLKGIDLVAFHSIEGVGASVFLKYCQDVEAFDEDLSSCDFNSSTPQYYNGEGKQVDSPPNGLKQDLTEILGGLPDSFFSFDSKDPYGNLNGGESDFNNYFDPDKHDDFQLLEVDSSGTGTGTED